MTTRLTPERFAEILVEFNRVLNSARQEHHALCARGRMGRELIAEVVALREERDALQAKVSEVPGLTAALDEARWERDVAKGEKTAGSQALKEIERLLAELADLRARFEEKLREPVPVLKLESSPVDQFIRDYANNLRQRADSLDKEERFATADTRRDMASFVSRLRQALATGRPFRETELYQEPR